MAEWRNSEFRPCHYVAVDRVRRRLVLAIRGSLELGDVATDLTASPMDWQFGPQGVPGHVHQGLMSAATYVQLNTHEALRAGAERHPGWPLLVTGALAYSWHTAMYPYSWHAAMHPFMACTPEIWQPASCGVV